ncbi:MAG TPA: Fic family protein [Bacteroidia bacterium]|nr:Fic family protein [Bacteroidia bacterium]
MNYKVAPLPPKAELETKAILKKLPGAHRYLAELKGSAASIPNESILINTLALQEAKDSSAIENIITTHDELYKAQLFEKFITNASAKEVGNYAEALKHGFELVRKNKYLSGKHILQIQEILEQNDAGYRRLPGTALINDATGKTVYTPPQLHDVIVKLMDNLVEFINIKEMHDVDPLIKMAVLHFQFESIHPFYDGNGRTGRILNILYLVLNELLDLPILYLSRYIIRHKSDYYRLLQHVRDTGEWEEWILYMLTGIEQTAKESIVLITEIRKLMQDYKHNIRKNLPKIYSQDLLNNLFRHPYTKIEFMMNELNVTRITATRYLDLLVENGYLKKEKNGRTNFYINDPLYQLFKGKSIIDTKAPPIITINPVKI